MAVDSIRNSRQINNTLKNQEKVLEKLASGKRINRASDDAAGLAIAEQLSSLEQSLGQASRNVSDATSAIQIADGALQQIGDIGGRLKELATQSANGTLSNDQRVALNNEYQALTQEAQRIAGTTEFNGQQLIAGQSLSVQVGTDSDPNSQITVGGTDGPGTIAGVASQNISTQAAAQSALSSIDTFISAVSSARGELGGSAARIETAGNNIAVERENAKAAESRIRDADIAELAAEKVKNDILARTSTALEAQTGKLREKTALQLLS